MNLGPLVKIKVCVAPQLPCGYTEYGEDDICIVCGGKAVTHQYDAQHFPYPVYGYQQHCHNCGVWYEDWNSYYWFDRGKWQ